jgi:signal transduction histidine kinase
MRYLAITCGVFVFGLLIQHTLNEFYLAHAALDWLQGQSQTNIIIAPQHPQLRDWLDIESTDAAELLSFIWNKLSIALITFTAITGTLLGILVAHFIQLQNARMKALEMLNNQLTDQQALARHSRQALLSLNDDLRLSRQEAEDLAGKLSRANVDLTARNSEMERFVYTVSHDLREPIVTISGHLQLLGRELKDAKQRFRLERARLSIEFMEKLLDNLLMLSRTIHQDFNATMVNLDDVVTPLVTMFSNQVEDAGGNIVVKAQPIEIYCNQQQLSQCLQNLMSNAIKYRSPERALLLEIDCEACADNICVIVRDNGIGIENSHQEKVFKVFETLNDGKDTGVGLAIVKSIMEKHGGTVALKSQSGVGSEFQLRFPKP